MKSQYKKLELDKVIELLKNEAWSDIAKENLSGLLPETEIDKIKKELETNPKYETGYEQAKQIVKSWIEKSSRKKIKEIKNLENDTENNKGSTRS